MSAHVRGHGADTDTLINKIADTVIIKNEIVDTDADTDMIKNKIADT